MKAAVLNRSGSTILRNHVVRQSGFDYGEQLPLIELASAATSSTSAMFGVVVEDIANLSTGVVTVSGLHAPVNLFSYSVDDKVYLSDTAGEMSATPGTIEIVVGYVVTARINGCLSVSCKSSAVQGAQGATGVQGYTGFYGQTGIQGVTGFYGQTGIQGITGILGISGVTGMQGLTGLEGQTGVQGITGILGISGVTGMQGLTGIVGNTGLQGVAEYVITDHIIDASIGVADNNSINTNFGAPGTITLSLDSSAEITTLTFFVMTAQEFRIDPDINDHFIWSGGAETDGKYLYSSDVGSSMTITRRSDGDWMITTMTSNWIIEP